MDFLFDNQLENVYYIRINWRVNMKKLDQLSIKNLIEIYEYVTDEEKNNIIDIIKLKVFEKYNLYKEKDIEVNINDNKYEIFINNLDKICLILKSKNDNFYDYFSSIRNDIYNSYSYLKRIELLKILNFIGVIEIEELEKLLKINNNMQQELNRINENNNKRATINYDSFKKIILSYLNKKSIINEKNYNKLCLQLALNEVNIFDNTEIIYEISDKRKVK